MQIHTIHPRQLARKDGIGLLLRAIVKVGTAFERFARNPALERARERERLFSKNYNG